MPSVPLLMFPAIKRGALLTNKQNCFENILKLFEHTCQTRERGREGSMAVHYTSPQGFIIKHPYLLANINFGDI